MVRSDLLEEVQTDRQTLLFSHFSGEFGRDSGNLFEQVEHEVVRVLLLEKPGEWNA